MYCVGVHIQTTKRSATVSHVSHISMLYASVYVRYIKIMIGNKQRAGQLDYYHLHWIFACHNMRIYCALIHTVIQFVILFSIGFHIEIFY